MLGFLIIYFVYLFIYLFLQNGFSVIYNKKKHWDVQNKDSVIIGNTVQHYFIHSGSNQSNSTWHSKSFRDIYREMWGFFHSLRPHHHSGWSGTTSSQSCAQPIILLLRNGEREEGEGGMAVCWTKSSDWSCLPTRGWKRQRDGGEMEWRLLSSAPVSPYISLSPSLRN